MALTLARSLWVVRPQRQRAKPVVKELGRDRFPGPHGALHMNAWDTEVIAMRCGFQLAMSVRGVDSGSYLSSFALY